MIKFIGEYTAKIDDKGRVVFPSPFKSIIPEGDDLRFIIKKDLFSSCLEMFSYEEWVRQSEDVKSRLNFFNREHKTIWREFIRDRAMVEPDGKLGRITIPKRLLDVIGAEKEILFVGNDHSIEIWAKERYDGAKLPEDEYSELAERILG